MSYRLPNDLKEAESQLFQSTCKYLSLNNFLRLSISLKFEGLKIEPLAIRFAMNLLSNGTNCVIAFSDFGSSSLFKRDYPELKDIIYTFKDLINSPDTIKDNSPLISISPQPYNYDEFYSLCNNIKSNIIMFNGKLEDSAIGIGSVGRDRKSNFIKSWTVAYSLEPLQKGALLFDFNHKWQLFSYTENGYIFIKSFEQKPDELIIESYI